MDYTCQGGRQSGILGFDGYNIEHIGHLRFYDTPAPSICMAL